MASQAVCQSLSKLVPGSRFAVRVRPRASSTGIIAEKDGAIFVSVAAPADGNKANIELVRFFTRLLKQKVRILHGRASREKILEIVK